MQLINYSKMLTSKQIKKCINLILKDKDYRSLNQKIIVYNSMLRPVIKLIVNSEFHQLKLLLNRTVAGVFLCKSDILIYPFNITAYKEQPDKDQLIKLQIIHDIYHEIRHAYQAKFCYDMFMKNLNNYTTEEHWDEQWVEQDAQEFAQSMLTKYKYKINKILKIKCNWYV